MTLQIAEECVVVLLLLGVRHFGINEMAKKDVPEIAEYTSSDATSTVEKKKKANN